MEFSKFAGFLRKAGYSDYETTENHRVFYEFNKMDFLYSDCAKKYDVDYKDGKITKAVMTQYWFGKTMFKDITTLNELYGSI